MTGKASRRLAIAMAPLLLAACVTTDKPRSAVEERAAQLVVQTCILVQTGDSGEPLRRDRLDTTGITITSVKKDGSGWVKIAYATKGHIFEFYYRTPDGARLCNGRRWAERFGPFLPWSEPVTLADLGGA